MIMRIGLGWWGVVEGWRWVQEVELHVCVYSYTPSFSIYKQHTDIINVFKKQTNYNAVLCMSKPSL